MGFLSIIGKGIQAMIDEATTPESFKAGQKFEEYVREMLFIDRYFELVERTHNYSTNSKDYVQSSKKPDFKFRDKWTRQEFYVEAKFRTGLYNGKIQWCNESQLRRYQYYNRELPVFLMLGMGEKPALPEFIALIPISNARYTGLFPNYAVQFEIKLDIPVKSQVLWNR